MSLPGERWMTCAVGAGGGGGRCTRLPRIVADRNLPVRKLAEAWPRTATFMAGSMRRGMPFRQKQYPEIPTRPTTATMMAGVMADELLLATMGNDRLVFADDDLARIGAELRDAVAVLNRRGWLDKPADFHLTPPAPTELDLHHNRLRLV